MRRAGRATARGAHRVVQWGVVVLALLAAELGIAQAPDRAQGLRDLRRVALDVSLPPDLRDAERDLAGRVERALAATPGTFVLDRRSADTLRVVATVHAEGATRMRGFWLPFSGTYAVGAVRLEVERPVLLPGATSAAPVPAIVWRRDRVIAGPWRHAAAEIGGAVEELLRALLDDHGRARGGA